MKRFYPLLLAAISLLIMLSPACKTPKSQTAHLGEIDFSVTSLPQAQSHFKEGLLLLHSFEYADAKVAFVKAQETDSDFAMAYWGEAMTYNHPLWSQQDYAKGTTALAQIDSIPSAKMEALTPLEKDLIASAKVLYGEGDKKDRDLAFSKHMEALYNRYPGNHEVAALYALSLLGSVPVGRNDAVYGKGAIIAQGILKENPNHPGALHYLIHSYDDPDHAHLALNAANNYSKVAPDAAHALHMPSHIYVAMGMWDEVISSNIASYGASLKRKEAKNLDNDARNYHAFAWLMYGYLQKGKFGEATRIMDDMTLYTAEKPSKRARDYMIYMTGNYLVETGNWTHTFADFDIKYDDLNIKTRAEFDFIKGMKAFANKSSEALELVIARMVNDRQAASLIMEEKGRSMCGSVTQYIPDQLDIDKATVMEMELQAMLASLRGNETETEKWLKAAAELEGRISYSFGPPDIPKPSYELYGEWLLKKERYQEARSQFEKALERAPKRALSLKGLDQIPQTL